MKKKKCEACEDYEAQVKLTDLYDGIETFICQNCLVSYVDLNLSSEQFFNLLKNKHTTEEFMLHSDFYDKDTGEALQPRR